VEKSQYELCLNVLRRLDSAGVLKHIVLVGSWCGLFYKQYLSGVSYHPLLKTRDLDLLIPRPSDIKTQVNVPDLLKDYGFVVGFIGSEGFIRLEHPQLIVEFLVPERSRATTGPYPLPKLGMNAQALRFLNYLAKDTLVVEIQDVKITLPHPARFALHKLIISHRRPTEEKRPKDIEAAAVVLKALIRKGLTGNIEKAFMEMPPRWKGMVRKAARNLEIPEFAGILEKKD
jgi:hypothetical protein